MKESPLNENSEHSEHSQHREHREHRAAVAPRTLALVLGTLLLGLGFIYSYVAAFHDPTPHDITVDVAAQGTAGGGAAGKRAEGAVEQTVAALDSLDGHPVDARAVDSPDDVRAAVTDGDSDAGLVIDPTSKRDHLYVASGGGTAVVSAVDTIVSQVADSRGRTYATTDLVPLADGDAKGLTGFYLAVGWVVGGYLVASLLGVTEGARPRTRRGAAVRLGLLAPYAVALGFGGALIAGPGLGAWEGHLWSLGMVGSLTVFGVAAATVAMQVLLGTLGIGVAVLLFVVLGNPSAGGPYPDSLLPSFWSGIGPFIPTGAATQLVRDTVYFGADGQGWQLWVLAAYVVLGVTVTIAMTRGRDRTPAHRDAEPEPATP